MAAMIRKQGSSRIRGRPPCADERANAGLGCAVTGVVWDTLKRGDGREKNNRAAIANERECLLNREKAAHVVVEILFRRVNERLSINIVPSATRMSILPFSSRILA